MRLAFLVLTLVLVLTGAARAAPLLIAPADKSLVTVPTPLFLGTAEPGATVTITVDGQVVGMTSANAAGQWTMRMETALPDGEHTVTLRQVDASGLFGPASTAVGFTVTTQKQDDKPMFLGLRGGFAMPANGNGVAALAGLEFGFAPTRWAAPSWGLHLISAFNTPAFGPFDAMAAAGGIAVDIRFNFEQSRLLALYPTLALGFLLGRNHDGANAVLPLFDPGFGVRLKIADHKLLGGSCSLYTSLEFGFASFYIPFMNLSLGMIFDV